MGPETKTIQAVDDLSLAFAQAAGVWVGCDWPTEFGGTSLNLENLSSAHAVLMARATADKEADAWWEASRWLARVEQEALEAEREALAAVQAGKANQWVAALTHARGACDIEARYHNELIWQPLRTAAERALKTSRLQ